MPCENFGMYPCGKCGGCYSKRARDWSIRLSAERALHSDASFVTLTYAQDPIHVSKTDAQKFFRSLRKLLAGKKIRYFLGAEYGTKNKRPHYHAIVFGHDFSGDSGAYLVRAGLYSSPLLEKAWPLGFTSSGSATPASIQYVANYLLGKSVEQQYLDLETGESIPLAPVFALMSRRPGIGAGWIDRHDAETYKDDSVQLGGLVARPPRYFDLRIFGEDSLSLQNLRASRVQAERDEQKRSPEKWLKKNDPNRRIARAKIAKARRNLTQKDL